MQGLATLKAFGQSKQRGRVLAQRAQHLYRSTMGVVAANGATSGASIFFMVTGAAWRWPSARCESATATWSCGRC